MLLEHLCGRAGLAQDAEQYQRRRDPGLTVLEGFPERDLDRASHGRAARPSVNGSRSRLCSGRAAVAHRAGAGRRRPVGEGRSAAGAAEAERPHHVGDLHAGAAGSGGQTGALHLPLGALVSLTTFHPLISTTSRQRTRIRTATDRRLARCRRLHGRLHLQLRDALIVEISLKGNASRGPRQPAARPAPARSQLRWATGTSSWGRVATSGVGRGGLRA